MSASERLATVLLTAGLGSNLGIHRDADDLLTADPDLAQDIEDGAALRRLREAADAHGFPFPVSIHVWEMGGPGPYNPDPRFRYQVGIRNGIASSGTALVRGNAGTLAAAADACRVALEEGR